MNHIFLFFSDSSSELVRWAGETFQDGLFVMFEQVKYFSFILHLVFCYM